MLNIHAISNSLYAADRANLLQTEATFQVWKGIVARTPGLAEHPIAIKWGLIAKQDVVAAKVVEQPAVTVFVDPKTSVQHTRGCGVVYLLSEARKPGVSFKKAWSLVDRVLKHMTELQVPEQIDVLYRSGDVAEYIDRIFPMVKALVGTEYATCECRHHQEEAKLDARTCPKCHSHKVVSNGVKRLKCRDCKKTFNK